MSSIGETLREERLKRKLSLDQIAQETKISSRMLQAIETEQFDKLPGGVFAKSFVRQYARALKLDEDELARQVDALTAQPVKPSLESLAAAKEPAGLRPPFKAQPKIEELNITVPPVQQWQTGGGKGAGFSNSLPALALVVLVMLLCSVAYSWLQRSSTVRGPSAEAAQPASTAARQPAKPERPAPAAVPPAATYPNGANRLEPTPPITTPVSAAPQALPFPSAVPPVERLSPVRVRVTARGPVWMQAVSDGRISFTGILQANQSRDLEATDRVLVKVANAGAVEITLNGKPVGALGPSGQGRTVQLTSGGFQILPPAPKAPRAFSDPLL